MAYRNLVAQAVATRSETYKRFRDWLCSRNGSYDYSTNGLGWTYHDSSWATNQDNPASGDYFVAKSTGESTKEDLYFKITYSATSGQIQIQMYQYWNNSTHAGVNGQTAVNNWQVAESTSGTLYVYGNLNKVFVGTIFGASIYGCLFGLMDDAAYDTTVATCSSSVSSGSSVVVAMDVVPSSWVVGGKVVVRDDANIERITISNINSLNVTFTNIVASYNAGCKFSKDYPVVCQNTNNLVAAFNALFGHNNTKQAATTGYTNTMVGTSGDPDALDSEYIAAPFIIGDATTGFYGSFDDILSASTSFTHLGVYTLADGTNYRAFISMYSGCPLLFKEV